MEYAAYRCIEGGDKNVGIIYPADDAFMTPEALGIVKNCPHAELFLRYNPEWQRYLGLSAATGQTSTQARQSRQEAADRPAAWP
jgi:hypothetical protein